MRMRNGDMYHEIAIRGVSLLCFSLALHGRSLKKMSVDSPGCKSVVQCTSDLTSLLKHHLSSSGKLLEKGLITEAIHNYVLTAQGVSAQDKAAIVVSCLTDRIKSTELFIP